MAKFRCYSRAVNRALQGTEPNLMTRADWLELAAACLDQAYEDVETRVRIIGRLPLEDGRELLKRINEWPGETRTQSADA